MNYLELGGTLFIPANHKHLRSTLLHNKYPQLRSCVVDFEDGLPLETLPSAQKDFESLLQEYTKQTLHLFVRPRNEAHLKEFLEMQNIEKIEGFVLPKFSLSNAKSYLLHVKQNKFYIMPSIEGEELFDVSKLLKLRDILLTNKEKIVLVRFGAEDMLRQLGMRRGCEQSLFDTAVGATVLGNFIAVFKSAGFGVSGGVYPCFKEKEGFLKDVQRDLLEGLFSKTIVHPDQIELCNECYKVDAEEYLQAQEILANKEAVFNQNSTMAEVVTRYPHAQMIVQRAAIYGVR